MAGKKNQVINLTKDDFKRKSFKTVPGGTYFIKITPKTALKAMKGGEGINVAGIVTKGKEKKHKGVTFFDNIGPDVKWKIAQLVGGLKIKKTKFTMAELLKLIKGGELRAILREKTFEGKKRNEVVQYLPLTVSKDEPQPATDEDDDEEEETVDEADTDEETDEEDEDEDEEDEGDDADEEDEEEDEDDEEEDDEDEDDEEEEEDDVDDEDDEEDDEEEDDEEEEADDEPEPPRKRGTKKSTPPMQKRPVAKVTTRKPRGKKK